MGIGIYKSKVLSEYGQTGLKDSQHHMIRRIHKSDVVNRLSRNGNNIATKITNSVFNESMKYLKFLFMNNIYSKHGVEMVIRFNSYNRYNMGCINDWIRHYDKNYNFHSKCNKRIENTMFMMSLDKHTFALVLAGEYTYSKQNFEVYMNRNFCSGDLKIYIFGKNFKKYERQIKRKLNSRPAVPRSHVRMRNVTVSTSHDIPQTRVITKTIKARYFDTLFYNKEEIEQIINHIDTHLSKRKIHEEHNITFKTGLLLTGVPGVGKSSLITALATKYRAEIINIDMSNFHSIECSIIDEIVRDSIVDGDNDDLFIVSLEDIDCIFESSSARETSETEGTVITRSDANVINKLLELLDSASSPSNVIFVATTNYPEKMTRQFNIDGKQVIQFDTALTRGKRLEKTVEIHCMTRDVAVEMCRSFEVPEENIDEILDKVKTTPDGRYNQSEVERVLFTTI